MKLFFSILLMSTVLCSELVNVIDTGEVDIFHLDSSLEREIEKELSENLEDVIKIKFHNSNLDLVDKSFKSNDLALNWIISPPYLEIHSPPPDRA
jgi:hypothetical protein